MRPTRGFRLNRSSRSTGTHGGFLSEFAAGIIRAEFPNLKEKMHVRSAVIAWQPRAIELIDCRAA